MIASSGPETLSSAISEEASACAATADRVGCRVPVLVLADALVHAAGLELILAAERRFGSVKTVTCVTAATAAVRKAPESAVVIDVQACRSDQALATLLDVVLGLRAIVLCVRDREEALRLFNLGCAACVDAAARPHEIGDAINAAVEGNRWCSPRLLRLVLSELAPGIRSATPPDLPVLTVREREVMLNVERGMSNQEIARTLSIAVPTVKNHVRNVCRKLGVRNRWQVSQAARRRPITVMAARTSGLTMRALRGTPRIPWSGGGHGSRECSRVNAARTSITVRWSAAETRATCSSA